MTSLLTRRLDAVKARPQHTAVRRGRRPTSALATLARALRFATTGLVAGLTQLGLLAALTWAGWPDLAANIVAFLLAAQVNFALSSCFTWRDRRDGSSLPRRWLAFHGAILGMALVNLAVFAATRTVLPALAASAAGIAVAAAGNFVIGDRVVFRAAHGDGPRSALAPADAAA